MHVQIDSNYTLQLVVLDKNNVGISQGQIYLRYHEGPEALVKLDADHFLNIPKQSADLDKAIAWSLDWFDKAFTEQEHPEESEESEGFFDGSGFDLEGFCEKYPQWPICG